MLPTSSRRCFLRSGKFNVSSFTVSWIVPALTWSRAVLLVNFRKGVGMITVAMLCLLFLSELVVNYFFFFELLFFVQQPGTERNAVILQDGNDQVREIRLR